MEVHTAVGTEETRLLSEIGFRLRVLIAREGGEGVRGWHTGASQKGKKITRLTYSTMQRDGGERDKYQAFEQVHL